jgi:RHS repeat-associated protein
MGTNAYGHAYDPIGNRTEATNNTEVLTYLSNALNPYTNILCAPAPLREEIPAYDLDGNLTNYNGWTFAWSGENRLIQASNAQHLVTYAYDYQGRMVAKQFSRRGAEAQSWEIEKTSTLIWDGYNIIQSLTHTQTHTLTNSFIWGLDLSGSLQGFGGVGGLLAEVHDGAPYFAAFDANGNVTEYLSTNVTIAAHYEYSPFGEIVVQSGDLADSFTHRFSTKPWCAVTGLSEYEFRMYSPVLGRWVNRDPIGERGGLSLLYSICHNDVVNEWDNLGLVPGKCCKQWKHVYEIVGLSKNECIFTALRAANPELYFKIKGGNVLSVVGLSPIGAGAAGASGVDAIKGGRLTWMGRIALGLAVMDTVYQGLSNTIDMAAAIKMCSREKCLAMVDRVKSDWQLGRLFRCTHCPEGTDPVDPDEPFRCEPGN